MIVCYRRNDRHWWCKAKLSMVQPIRFPTQSDLLIPGKILIQPNQLMDKSWTEEKSIKYVLTASRSQLCHKLYSSFFAFSAFLPSVLWCCWLGGKKGIQPVKTEWWDTGVVTSLGEVQICIRAQRIHCHSLFLAPVNPDWFYLPGFTFLVLGSSSNSSSSSSVFIILLEYTFGPKLVTTLVITEEEIGHYL